MSNPEPGIYTGSLNKDIDLVYFKKDGLYGVHYKDISYEGRDTTRMKRAKQPLETFIRGLRPNEWTKYSHESETVIIIAANNGYDLTFEGNIRPAITEIMDSIRSVHKDMLLEKFLEPLLDILPVKKCYYCRIQCEPPVHECNYCPVTKHELCQYQEDCSLRCD